MRALAATLGISFGAHVVIASVLVIGPRLLPHHPPKLDPAPRMAGETFELPAPETPDVPLANASPSPESNGNPLPEDGDAPARPTPPVKGKRSPTSDRASHAGRPSAGRPEQGTPEGTPGSSATSTLYGAVGERSAADLATAFTRGVPQAASADPVWRTAAIGSAGDAEVILTLDESGHIEATDIKGTPSAALTSAIRRTLALIKGRPFVAKGKTTKLHLSATISTDAVHDGLHGDVFAIGGSYTGGEGSAFFALSIGRRIDVRVRLK